MNPEEKLSIIIISKDTGELLKGLFGSIEKDKPLSAHIKEVVLVDNASTDGTDELIKNSFPHVVYIRNIDNTGFAAAVNRGVASSGGEYILLLNSDTLLIEGEISKMLRFMTENKDVGVCGPQLVYPDKRLQRSFAYAPSLFFEIPPPSLLEHLFPEKYSAKSSPLHAPRSTLDIPSLIGAAIMIRRTVLDALGGFDERFFFFLEETDFCIRAKKSGQRIVFYPDANVIHLQGKTVGKNWVQGRIEYNISLYKFIKKHHTYTYYSVFKSVRFLKCLLFLIVFSVFSLLLLKKRIKRSYAYYSKLFLWHLKGCPDMGGLRNSP